MTFHYSRQGLLGAERRLERLLEILPGAASWATLLGMLGLAFWKPLLAAILVIAFDLYWLLRMLYMTLFLVLAYLRLSIERQTDWLVRARGLDGLASYLERRRREAPPAAIGARLSWWIHQREIESLIPQHTDLPRTQDLYHLIIIPIVRETQEIIEPGVASLAQQTFPTAQLLVVVALEERADAAVQAGALAVQERYRERFLDCLVTRHPDGQLGEARVKGANATHAAKEAAAYFAARGISYEDVIVSCFDADTVVGPDYMSCLTYHFLVCPDRTQASFQPIPVYHNNIWATSGFARVLDIGSSFFQLIEATNPQTLVTFSSHSMSFKALVDVGYWPVDMISDDSAIFWKALLHFGGRYRVIPMYITLSMDVVHAKTWPATIMSVYRQKRRWAWGVENFPIVIRGFLHDRRIRWRDKLRHAFKLLEGHVAWAAWPVLLGVMGWLPALSAGQEFSSSVVYYSAPRITGTIFALASITLLTTVVLSLCLLPKKPTAHPFLQRLGHACEWLLVPPVSVFLSALPALDAQTRLLLGRYMEFWVTDKQRS